MCPHVAPTECAVQCGLESVPTLSYVMKRSLEKLLDGNRNIEEDELLRVQLRDAEERERKEEANKASSASRVAHLDKLVAHWDAMGLRSAAGCRVTSPVSLPRIGMALYELPFPLSIALLCSSPLPRRCDWFL